MHAKKLSILMLALWGGLAGRIASASPRDQGFFLRESWRPHVGLFTLQKPERTGTTQLAARVRYDEEVTQRVVPLFGGRITHVFVAPQDKVRKGDALVAIVSPEIAAARAELVRAREESALAKKNLVRTESLLRDEAIAVREAAVIRSEAHKAEAEVQRILSHMEALQIAPERGGAETIMRARLDGSVTERTAQVGQIVRADGELPLVTVSTLSRLWVEADLFDPSQQTVAVGSPVGVVIPALGHEERRASLVYVGAVVDPVTRATPVRLRLPNKDNAIKPQMVATVLWPQAASGLWIPSQAIVSIDQQVFVWVVEEDSRLVRRNVVLGAHHRGETFVKQGLCPGETVVSRGALFLQQASEE